MKLEQKSMHYREYIRSHRWLASAARVGELKASGFRCRTRNAGRNDSPGAHTHLSKALLDAVTYSLALPAIDATVIARVIRIITGRPFRSVLPQRVVADTGIHELILSVRFDRSPEECVAHLVRLAEAKDSRRGSRDLRLDELHSIDEGVAWARSTLRDIEAWRRGEIAWDAVDAGVLLNGPPGTGKTTFAKAFAAESGLPLISATLAKWQGSGGGASGQSAASDA